MIVAAIPLALFWGSRLSSNNGRLNTELSMSPIVDAVHESERQQDPAG